MILGVEQRESEIKVMNKEKLEELVQEIVAEAKKLSAKHTDQANAPVNYACVFTQNEDEYVELHKQASKMGRIVQNTEMGPVFQIEPIETTAGSLEVLKVRKPDIKRPERGDADFTVEDYEVFKEKYLKQPEFKLISRPNMEMIELFDVHFNVLAYYSHPVLAKTLNLQLQDKPRVK